MLCPVPIDRDVRGDCGKRAKQGDLAADAESNVGADGAVCPASLRSGIGVVDRLRASATPSPGCRQAIFGGLTTVGVVAHGLEVRTGNIRPLRPDR